MSKHNLNILYTDFSSDWKINDFLKRKQNDLTRKSFGEYISAKPTNFGN